MPIDSDPSPCLSRERVRVRADSTPFLTASAPRSSDAVLRSRRSIRPRQFRVLGESPRSIRLLRGYWLAPLRVYGLEKRIRAVTDIRSQSTRLRPAALSRQTSPSLPRNAPSMRAASQSRVHAAQTAARLEMATP